MEELAVYRLLTLLVSSFCLFLWLLVLSISLSVHLCLYLCVCVCSSWIEKAQPENNFSVSWLFNIAFCHAKKEVKHCTQVLRETRDNNAINLPTIPILTPFFSSLHPHLRTPAKMSLWVLPNNKLKLEKLQSACWFEMNFYFAAHGAIVNEIHNFPQPKPQQHNWIWPSRK